MCDHPHYRSCLRESSSCPRFGCAPCMDSHLSLDVCGCALSAAFCIAHLLLHVASGRMAQSSNVFIHGCTISSAQGGIYINNEDSEVCTISVLSEKKFSSSFRVLLKLKRTRFFTPTEHMVGNGTSVVRKAGICVSK